jgi:hypothetical protein
MFRTVYKNLDTAFVDLSALLGYLRKKDFKGRVQVETDDYKAEIFLLKGDRIEVRETDFTGEGEEALQKVLLRTKRPGVTLNVYRMLEEPPQTMNGEKNFSGTETERCGAAAKIRNSGDVDFSQPKAASFEFDSSNAERTALTIDEWREFLQIVAELLTTIDQTLAEAGLDFTPAFKKACSEIAADYPFLDPKNEIFAYREGEVFLRRRVKIKFFAAGLNETLRRILEKLAAKPKFAAVHRQTEQKILALVHRRRPLYEKFFITPRIEKILGV